MQKFCISFTAIVLCSVCIAQDAHASTREERLARIEARRLARLEQRDGEPTTRRARPARVARRSRRSLRAANLQQRTRTDRTARTSRRAERLAERTSRRQRTRTTSPRSNTDVLAVLQLTNEQRAKHNLPALRINTKLMQSAEVHAKDMLAQNYFSHESPSGSSAEDRIRATGYLEVNQETCNCRGWSASVAENIAYGQDTAEHVVQDWMDSPSHKENILSDVFTEIGIARVGDYWVQNFGNVTLKY